MKVVAINGNLHKVANTYYAIKIIGSKLEEKGIDFELIHVGNKEVRGCMGCGTFRMMQNEKCTYSTDPINEWFQQMKDADGIIISSQVYYSGVAGTMKSFLDRVFYVSGSNGNFFRLKVGAAVVAVRRTGGSSTMDTLNHYLAYFEMMLATSSYWNIIHGTIPSEALQDAEGVQIMEVLGNNMAWLLKMREMTKNTLPAPAKVQKVVTSFIR